MKFKDWLSEQEDSGSYVCVAMEKDVIGGGYFGTFRLHDGHNSISFDFDFETLEERKQVIYDLRKLKKAINDFYNAIKAIPDEELEEKKEE